MKVLIINGSPKGEYSITLHTALFLEKKFPQCKFEIIHVGKKIKSFEKDMSHAIKSFAEAELVVFSYPVYTFLVPAQLHRFMELLHESGISFKGKYATQISTSKHFYDTTAHEFMRENLTDLGFTVIEGLSADMEDLPTEKGQNEAFKFFEYVLWQIKGAEHKIINTNKRVVVVTDCEDDNEGLRKKINLFIDLIGAPVDIVNILKFPFKGSCQGCFNCAATGECIYKDGFTDLLRNDIHKHDAIVYAFTIRNHSMGSRFKMYDDRQFCNGHRTVTMGTPFGYIIEGDINAEPNLKKVLVARAQVGGNFLAGLACNDSEVKEMAEAI